MDLTRAALLAGAAAIAGVINSIAGGGTLISFPAAIAAGMSPLVANATNAVALTPAALGSAWAYRRELARDKHVLRALLLPSLLGGAIGAGLLLVTPQRVFDAAVPGLVLLATLLLLWQNLRRTRPQPPGTEAAADGEWQLPRRAWVVALLQLVVAVYGGYFGAGMGIMVLALLSMLGGRDIHRMNAVKVVIGAVVNGVASIAFVAARAVDGEATAVMTAGAVVGGLGGGGGGPARRSRSASA
jgi:uncharacterized membrane protein YfcA